MLLFYRMYSYEESMYVSMVVVCMVLENDTPSDALLCYHYCYYYPTCYNSAWSLATKEKI